MPMLGNPQSCEVLYCSGVRQSLNGTTTKSVITSVFIPAGKMGPNSSLEIEAVFGVTTNTNIKTTDISVGPNPASVTSLFSRPNSSAATFGQAPKITLTNRGLTNSQVLPYASLSTTSTNVPSGVGTSAIDFSVDQNLYVFGTLANSADFIYLEHFVVTIRNPGR